MTDIVSLTHTHTRIQYVFFSFVQSNKVSHINTQSLNFFFESQIHEKHENWLFFGCRYYDDDDDDDI